MASLPGRTVVVLAAAAVVLTAPPMLAFTRPPLSCRARWRRGGAEETATTAPRAAAALLRSRESRGRAPLVAHRNHHPSHTIGAPREDGEVAAAGAGEAAADDSDGGYAPPSSSSSSSWEVVVVTCDRPSRARDMPYVAGDRDRARAVDAGGGDDGGDDERDAAWRVVDAHLRFGRAGAREQRRHAAWGRALAERIVAATSSSSSSSSAAERFGAVIHEVDCF